MFLLRKPDQARLDRIRDIYEDCRPTYREVGATLGQLPEGFNIDRHRVQLGTSHETFEKAKAAFRNWQMLRLGWVEPCWPEHRIRQGETIGTLARICGVWSVNVCRLVAVIEERGDVEKYGFAYGTLPGHVERGEEQFTLEWHHDDDSVWYNLLAFSKPGLLISWLSYPFVRRLQKHFAIDSMQAMKDIVQ